MSFRTITSAASGMCLGYAMGQVVFHYFFIGVIFKILHLNLLPNVRPLFGPEITMNFVLLGFVLFQMGRDEKLFKACVYGGMIIWLISLLTGR